MFDRRHNAAISGLGYRWRLREVMGTRGLWHTTELRPLLMALCDALDCEMGDLLERVAEAPPKRRRAAGATAPADADVLPLRPKPARIAPRPKRSPGPVHGSRASTAVG